MNYITQYELNEVTQIMSCLGTLLNSLDAVSFGNVPLLDSNGEVLGHLVYADGDWKFYPGETVEE